MSRFLSKLILLVGAGASIESQAALLTWPGSAPCSGSLQACINAAGLTDTIQIASNDPIDENILIEDRPVNMRAAFGFKPRLAAGRNFRFTFNNPPLGLSLPWLVRIADLQLDGGRFDISSAYSGRIILDNLRATNAGISNPFSVSGFQAENQLTSLQVELRGSEFAVSDNFTTAVAVGSGFIHNFEFLAEDNLIYSKGLDTSAANQNGRTGMQILSYGVNQQFELRRNRFVGDPNNQSLNARFKTAIRFQQSQGDSPSSILRIIDNLVLTYANSSFFYPAVRVSTSLGSTLLRVESNTISASNAALGVLNFNGVDNNVSGRVWNNILHSNDAQFGIRYIPETYANFIQNDYNLIDGAAFNTGVLGAHTLTTDAQFAAGDTLRLSAQSAARDSGDASARSLLGPGNLPTPIALDADGLRRIKGSALDRGAFEFGDDTLLFDTTSSATSNVLNFPQLDSNPSAILHVTRSEGKQLDALVVNPRPMSQSYNGDDQRWRLISDDAQAINSNSGFSIFDLVPGGEVGKHLVTTGNVFSNSGTTLPTPWDTLPNDWIVLVSATRGAGFSSIANPHPFGAAYLSGQWRVVNTDGSIIPVGAAFNVYAQAPSRNAFVHRVSVENQPVATVSVIDHPSLNGVPCANPHVSINAAGQMPVPHFSVHYESSLQRWFVQTDQAGTTQLTPGNLFFLVVDPKASADDCRGDLFADGFEN